MSSVTLDVIRPFVRFSNMMTLPSGFSRNNVHACDHRLIYVHSGTLHVYINEEKYIATRGELFLYPPSARYSILNTADTTAKIMSVNFDYCTTESSDPVPIPTIADRAWSAGNAVEEITFSDADIFNAPLHMTAMQMLEPIFTEMNAEALNMRPHRRAICGLLMHRVLLEIHRCTILRRQTKRNALMEEVTDYIRRNCCSRLTNEMIGKEFNYHPNYINRLLRKHAKKTLHQYVLTCRVERAHELLQTTDLPVTVIAKQVGFSSLKHFSQTFKQHYGHSPITFRE